jgi:phage antirepressor YoqD-like protein
MSKLYDPGLMALKLSMIEDDNAYLRAEFRTLNPKRPSMRYTPRQKAWAVNKAGEIGVRATARLLGVERRTIQRWLRAEGVRVRRAPYWVYEWAETRNRRRAKWARIKGN